LVPSIIKFSRFYAKLDFFNPSKPKIYLYDLFCPTIQYLKLDFTNKNQNKPGLEVARKIFGPLNRVKFRFDCTLTI
jgi:hypothetical protein